MFDITQSQFMTATEIANADPDALKVQLMQVAGGYAVSLQRMWHPQVPEMAGEQRVEVVADVS